MRAKTQLIAYCDGLILRQQHLVCTMTNLLVIAIVSIVLAFQNKFAIPVIIYDLLTFPLMLLRLASAYR